MHGEVTDLKSIILSNLPVPANDTALLILVAEDEPVIRMNAVSTLRDVGFDVVEAHDAEEALLVLETRAIGVRILFTDIQMNGEIDGLALSRIVRDRWPHISILVASGFSVQMDAEIPLRGRFMAKPYEQDQL